VPFSLQPSANPMLPIDDTRLALHRPGLLDPYRHGEPPAWSVPGTELSLAAAWELACFAQSAYAPDEVIAARLERRGWELDLLRDRDGIRAFVALRGDGEGVVVFCGTRGDIFSNIVDDLDARWRPWGPGRVHRGFLRALDSAWPALASRLEPTRRWCFAGHSLGGALALLAALRRGGELRGAAGRRPGLRPRLRRAAVVAFRARRRRGGPAAAAPRRLRPRRPLLSPAGRRRDVDRSPRDPGRTRAALGDLALRAADAVDAPRPGPDPFGRGPRGSQLRRPARVADAGGVPAGFHIRQRFTDPTRRRYSAA